MLKEWLSKALRFCLNWKPLQELPTEDSVVLYLHSSYADCLPVLMNYDQPKLKFCYFIAMPQLFNRVTTSILRYLQFLPSTKLEDKNKGAVQNFVNEFRALQEERGNSKESVILFLSPKGTVKKRDWRTGYYHLAKTLQVPIYVVILDWIERDNRCYKVIDISDFETQTEPEIRAKLESYLAFAPPLNPERCEFELPAMKTENMYLIWNMLLPFDLCVTSLIFFIPSLIKLYYLQKSIHVALLQCTVLCSYLYHRNNENLETDYGRAIHNLDISYSIATFLYFTATASYISPFYIFLTVISLFFYAIACPRGCSKHRGKYALLHPMFHVLAGLASYEITNYV